MVHATTRGNGDGGELLRSIVRFYKKWHLERGKLRPASIAVGNGNETCSQDYALGE